MTCPGVSCRSVPVHATDYAYDPQLTPAAQNMYVGGWNKLYFFTGCSQHRGHWDTRESLRMLVVLEAFWSRLFWDHFRP